MASTAWIPQWVETPPALFDIVTCYYPETDPKPDGQAKLRPALVTGVYKGKTTGGYLIEVCYGTKHLKLNFRTQVDLIIQNAADLTILRLPCATRFDLDHRVQLPWHPEFFRPWKGFNSPRLSGLTVDYQREYAYLMMQRLRQDGEQ